MTIFNVDEFRARLGAGGARPNQFMVTLGFPRVAPDFAASDQARFLISAASLPGQTVPPATVLYRGRQVHMVGDRVFAPWTTTVLNDTNFTVRTFIERWMNAMEDVATKQGQTQPQEYYADMEVIQLDRNGTPLKGYKFFGAFPTDLSEVGLDYGANDVISSFTCTWQYQHFAPTDVVGGTGGIGVALTGLFV